MTTPKRKIGDIGETLAVSYLLEHNYRIVERNWRCVYGEIDIIAKVDDTLWVFVEVKTRRASTTETALAGFSSQKRDKLLKAIFSYLHVHHLDDVLWRFDVIAIALPTKGDPLLEHLESALDW